MKTVFDKTTRAELINRINLLNENSKAQWGRMNIYQMLKHCTLWDEWVSSKQKNKQILLGRLFGKMALKNVLKDEKPLGRNSPTIPELRINKLGENGDVASEKTKWIGLIQAYAHFPNAEFVHTFFGKMTKEQIGYLAYKHADHHLRQFSA
jgi:Protein of unknown function (DUF1569)